MKQLVLAALLIAPATLSAQTSGIATCPAADSVVGPPPRRLSVLQRYDRITDTTQYEVRKEEVKILSSSPNSSLRLITSFQGQTPQAGSPAMTVFQVVVATTANTGGVLSQSANADQARLERADGLAMLVDGNQRLRLTRAAYNNEVNQANLIRNSRLLEISSYAIDLEQLRTIVTAKDKIEIAVGPVRGSLGRGEISAAKELYRVMACTSSAIRPAAADSTPSPPASTPAPGS
jgi:hypothetical protein